MELVLEEPPPRHHCLAGRCGVTLAIRCRMPGASRARDARSRSPRNAGEDDVLVVLLSGGGSALMALPAPGITLEAKQQTARTLMAQSADIYELNTVRKHLSGIKGGRLAAGVTRTSC